MMPEGITQASSHCCCPYLLSLTLLQAREGGRGWVIQSCSKYISTSCAWNGANSTCGSSLLTTSIPGWGFWENSVTWICWVMLSLWGYFLSSFVCHWPAQGLAKAAVTTEWHHAANVLAPLYACPDAFTNVLFINMKFINVTKSLIINVLLILRNIPLLRWGNWLSESLQVLAGWYVQWGFPMPQPHPYLWFLCNAKIIQKLLWLKK